jgi:hypothetical protein
VCSAAALLAAACGALGCSSAGQNLIPAASATKAAGLRNAAIASDRDVVVVVQSDAWPGQSRVLKHVTPLRVRVTNDNAQAIRVRYEDLRLIAADGTRYVALPPNTPQGTGDSRYGGTRETNNRGDEAASPQARRQNFTYSDFRIAPHLAEAYPGIELFHGAFDYDPQYYDKYAHAWHAAALPTAEMKSWALPEGVLESGGYVEGFVYFQRVGHNKGIVRFDSEFAQANDPSRTLAKIAVPFVVED